MVPSALPDLIALSDELVTLRGKPLATPRALPPKTELHPELCEVLSCGALGLRLQGVDTSRIAEFTKNAAGRGLRRKVRVFGWHPMGHTWFATPERQQGEARVLVFNRRDRLSATELTVAAFVDLCIEGVREALIEARAPKPDSLPTATPGATASEGESAPAKPRRRVARVVLRESDGASVVAGERTEELDGEELAYIYWCMSGLRQLEDGVPPDLSRWESRSLRSCRLEEVPAADDPDHPRYDAAWRRLTKRDRSARASVSHLIPSWKLTAPGSWILTPNELRVLRGSAQAIPPRHDRSPAQAAIWARWMALVQADEVELHVR